MKHIPLQRIVDVTIPNGAAVPAAGLDINGYVITHIEFPATMTGTGLTFKISQDDSTYVDLYNVTITKQDGKVVAVGSTYRVLEGLGRYVKIASSGNEGAARTFKLFLAPLKQ